MKKITENINVLQFEEAMKRYTEATCRETVINRQIEEDVNEVLEKYEQELMLLAQDKQTAFDIAHAYCAANKQELFAKRRRIGTTSGIAGYRLGTPRLQTLKGSNWKTVLKELKEKLPEYIRIAEEPAKDMLLADRHKARVAPMLMQIGVQVVQEDLFYIEPRKAA
jgi:phage host-nuclease inhibitor protein Gam